MTLSTTSMPPNGAKPKLNPDQVAQIRSRYSRKQGRRGARNPDSQESMAVEFGVTAAVICRVVNYRKPYVREAA